MGHKIIHSPVCSYKTEWRFPWDKNKKLLILSPRFLHGGLITEKWKPRKYILYRAFLSKTDRGKIPYFIFIPFTLFINKYMAIKRANCTKLYITRCVTLTGIAQKQNIKFLQKLRFKFWRHYEVTFLI